jgi:hypothetical protein
VYVFKVLIFFFDKKILLQFNKNMNIYNLNASMLKCLSWLPQ